MSALALIFGVMALTTSEPGEQLVVLAACYFCYCWGKEDGASEANARRR